MVPLHVQPDAKLVVEACSGSREAFGEIVNRYRNLVCALAFSRAGSVSSSEDLAQEAFVAAWQSLHQLRDPSRLRSWLSGIVQRIGASHVRTLVRRRTLQPTQSLDATLDQVAEGGSLENEPTTAESNPEQQAASDQESALVWKALAALPEKYRDPLVLFYREDQSVSVVAESLGLAEDAARQRLHRGRQLLRREMTQMIESTLRRTVPTVAFTAAVLAALPAVTPATEVASTMAVTGAAAKIGAQSKGLMGTVAGLPLVSSLVGPLAGLLAGLVSARLAASIYPEGAERTYMRRYASGIVIGVWIASLTLVVILAVHAWAMSAGAIILLAVTWTTLLLAGLMFADHRMQGGLARIQAQTGAAAVDRSMRYLARWQSKGRWLGLPLVDVSVSVHGTGRACGWIAVGDRAVSPLFALGGVSVAPVAIGGITVGVLSLSLFGIALGVVAFGSIAAGIWSWGIAAMGSESAAGSAAVAFDYATGAVATAQEANSALANQWIEQLWFRPLVMMFTVMSPLLVVVLAITAAYGWWRVSRTVRDLAG